MDQNLQSMVSEEIFGYSIVNGYKGVHTETVYSCLGNIFYVLILIIGAVLLNNQ